MEGLRRMLLKVTVNHADAEGQGIAESFSSLAASCCPNFSHSEFCSLFAKGKIPQDLCDRFLKVYNDFQTTGIKRRPLIFTNNTFPGILLGIGLTPLVTAAFLLNLVPLAAAHLVSRKMADDDNVITLWRLIVFAPVISLQWTAYLTLLYFFLPGSVGAAIIFGYPAITAAAILAYSHWKCLLIKTLNLFSIPKMERLKLAEGIREWCKTLC
jgi:hypothetical protein